jgi:AcrR family transcriptional regulator
MVCCLASQVQVEDPNSANQMPSMRQRRTNEGVRRAEILKTAAAMFASSGFRVSLQEIADACGILAGSLYHHFDSKEKIVEELISLYHRELEEVAHSSLERLKNDDKLSDFERITTLATAIFECAAKHKAALLQTFFDSPAEGGESVDTAGRAARRAVVGAMTEILQDACKSGYVRKRIDLQKLAEQICQSMLNFAVGTFHLSPEARQVPQLKCRMHLEGLVNDAPSNAELDRSDAFRAAETVIAEWSRVDADAQMIELREAARAVFGRRGFEVATIRDVAAAAKMSTGAIYRLVGSKEQLLSLVMDPYVEAATTGWDVLMNSNSTPVEKLDAMLWTGIQLQERFSPEFVIQLAWVRENPPPAWSEVRGFATRLNHIKRLLAAGERSGEIRQLEGSAKIRAYCLMDLIWVPRSIIRSAGTRAALSQARETLLRGAIART